jgi:hypothetical protein
MDKTLDQMLTAYEDLWRAAALQDVKHVAADGALSLIEGTVGRGSCAASIGTHLGVWPWLLLRTPQVQCPLCPDEIGSVGILITHLNDRHYWTWDTFANKFRDVLQQGGVDLTR